MIKTTRNAFFFNIFNETATVSLGFQRSKLLSKRLNRAQSPFAIPNYIRDSPLWFSQPMGNTSGSTPELFQTIAPIPLPNEEPFENWTVCSFEYYNKDQILNDMPHLHPVASPHDMVKQCPFSTSLSQKLQALKQQQKFTSNWFAKRLSVRKLGLVVKPGQSPHAIQRHVLIKLFHLSQLSNAVSIMKLPFSIRGTPMTQPLLVKEVEYRVALGSVGPHLFLSRKQLSSLPMVRLKPNAKEIPISFTNSNGNFVPRQPTVIHYYNISDVRFPVSFSLPSVTTSFEAQNPGVPVDGQTGEQLQVDALINLPNVTRAVWFTAHQLLHLGARCGVNAVPILVQASAQGTSEAVWYHVEDTEDPTAALAMVGKI
jgi:hypothetical protein